MAVVNEGEGDAPPLFSPLFSSRKKNGAKHCLHLEPERSCTSALLRNAAVAAAVQQMETLVGLSVRPRHVSTPRGGGVFLCYGCHKEPGWETDSPPASAGAAEPDGGYSAENLWL